MKISRIMGLARTAILVILAAPLANAQEIKGPLLVPWIPATTSTAGQYILGVVLPEPSSQHGTSFILDAPMTTASGENYYGFGIRVATKTPAGFRLSWRAEGGEAVDVGQIGGRYCDSLHAVMVNLSLREGRKQVGRDAPGSPNRQASERISASVPVFLYDCSQQIALDLAQQGIFVLLPESLIRVSGTLEVSAISDPDSGSVGLPLLIAGSSSAQGSNADPLRLHLVRGKPRLVVFGDSVAWGQGLPLDQKAASIVHRDLRDRYGAAAPLGLYAHSGSGVNHAGKMAIADIDPRLCLQKRELNGEIPRRDPVVQCQILEATVRECFVADRDIGRVPVPFFFCQEGLPRREHMPGEARFNSDLGPAIDIALMWMCIVDVGADWVVTGIQDIGNNELRTKTLSECNLENGLRDIRSMMPNANIVINEYFRIVSKATTPSQSGCTADAAAVLLAGIQPPFGAVGTLAYFAAGTLAVGASADRSEVFLQMSSAAHRSSLSRINGSAETSDRRGSGSLVFLSHPSSTTSLSSIYTGIFSAVFPLVCGANGLFAPVDDVKAQRIQDCARFYQTEVHDPLRPEPLKSEFMICVRGSGFHPNVLGNALVAGRIVSNRAEIYPRLRTFVGPDFIFIP